MKATVDTVLIVILNYKGWQDTLNCVDSVLAQDYDDIHIMLIENGSGDESADKLRHLADNPQIIFREESTNHGFAGGVNIGIRHAIEQNYQYVSLLNNDATLEPNWVSTLIDTIREQEVSSVGGIVLYRDGKTIDSTGDALSIWGLPFARQRDESRDQAHVAGLVFGCTAGASIYKTSLFRDIGLFDETFFAYFEDTDISWRAQLTGHSSYYQPEAIAYHEHGSTSRKMPGFTVQQTFQNLPVLVIKNTPLGLVPSMWLRFFVVYWLLFLRAVLRGQAAYAFRGFGRSIARLPHALRERRRIQSSRLVDTSYLRSIIYHGLPPENLRTIKRMVGRGK